jgi:inhibitor of KinA sporulation pathway (predicted exonuclease)
MTFDTRINVLDLEATCWDGPPPPGQVSEVIEIGLCVFDSVNAQRLTRHQLIVRPEHSEVSAFCTELTGWTAETLVMSDSFADTCTRLRREFHSDSRLMLSWGGYDFRQILRQCQATNTPFPFRRHIDLKAAHREFYQLPKRLGLGQALAHAGMAFEGRAHVGADDAWNVAALLERMLDEGFSLEDVNLS